MQSISRFPDEVLDLNFLHASRATRLGMIHPSCCVIIHFVTPPNELTNHPRNRKPVRRGWYPPVGGPFPGQRRGGLLEDCGEEICLGPNSLPFYRHLTFHFTHIFSRCGARKFTPKILLERLGEAGGIPSCDIQWQILIQCHKFTSVHLGLKTLKAHRQKPLPPRHTATTGFCSRQFR